MNIAAIISAVLQAIMSAVMQWLAAPTVGIQSTPEPDKAALWLERQEEARNAMHDSGPTADDLAGLH
jgi:hypothetical protein